MIVRCKGTMPYLVFLLAAFQLQCCAGWREAGDLYCGKDNCYDILELQRGASPTEIKKSYRKLALKWHPDKNRSPDATERFQKIGRAHEVLSDDHLREAYHYLLDNPGEAYQNYYNYYHATYAPKTNPLYVIAGTLIFLSGLQYINQNYMYHSMRRVVKYQPQFQKRVQELLKTEVKSIEKSEKRSLPSVEREAIVARIEADVLANEVQLHGTGDKPADVFSLIGVKAVLLPYYIAVAIYKFFWWHWRFTVQKQEYGEEECIYLTKKFFSIPDAQWEYMEPEQREEMLRHRLWEGDNLQKFKEKKKEEEAELYKNSGKYRAYKRWMRKNG